MVPVRRGASAAQSCPDHRSVARLPASGRFGRRVRPASCRAGSSRCTLRAIGAAAGAPKPPFSTSTASAICGLSAGAKAMNRAWSRVSCFTLLVACNRLPFMPTTCAVPVLPANRYSAPAKARAAGALGVDADHRLLDEVDVLRFPGRCLRSGSGSISVFSSVLLSVDVAGPGAAGTPRRCWRVSPPPAPAASACRRCSPGRCRPRWFRRANHFCCSRAGSGAASTPARAARRSDSPSISMPVLLPKPKLAHEAGDVVDAEVVGQHVIIGVAGLHDRLVHVDHSRGRPSCRRGSGGRRRHEIAGVGDRLLRRALAQFERRQRHERLEGRARRIDAVAARG